MGNYRLNGKPNPDKTSETPEMSGLTRSDCRQQQKSMLTSMRNTLRMQVLNSWADLVHNLGHFLLGERRLPLTDLSKQLTPLHTLHDNEQHFLWVDRIFIHINDLHDVPTPLAGAPMQVDFAPSLHRVAQSLEREGLLTCLACAGQHLAADA